MKLRALAVAVSAAFFSTAALAESQPAKQQHSGKDQNPVRASSPEYTQSMQKLRQSAQHLRESIQAIASKPAGPQREQAIRNAHEALFDTQRAMVSLPPELRTKGSGKASGEDGSDRKASGEQGYETSMKQLDRASNKLWASIETMQQEASGERRDQAIQHAHQAVWDTYEAMLAMPSGKRMEKQKTARAEGYGMLVVPTSISGSDRLANGCWARIFENPEYGGSHLTVVGPVSVPNLQRTAAHDWNGADSLIVGPKARVIAYDGENFEDREATIESGQSIPHLRDEKIGLFDKVDSLKVTCNA